MKQLRYSECTKEEWDALVKEREELKKQRVPLEECVKGRLYKLACRNLGYGVYDGEGGFIGLREKFGNVYLFTEFHWDIGAPHGTVEGIVDTDIVFQLGDVTEYNENLFYWLKGIEGREFEEKESECSTSLSSLI